MYLHLGQDIVVRLDEIIGIFDLENATIEKATKNFLSAAEKNGRVINVSYEMPKSFIVCCKQKNKIKRKHKIDNENSHYCIDNEIVYISQISSQTLRKRTGFIEDISNINF